ncbi:MAG: helix-turn-helix domain-containing protein, partial [Sphingobium sp.]
MAEILGARLESLIRERKTSQSAIARQVGVSQPSIGRLISGETRQTGKLLEIAQALKTSPAYLTGGTDDPTPDFQP